MDPNCNIDKHGGGPAWRADDSGHHLFRHSFAHRWLGAGRDRAVAILDALVFAPPGNTAAAYHGRGGRGDRS